MILPLSLFTIPILNIKLIKKVFIPLQRCDPNHPFAVTDLTNRKPCDSAHYLSVEQPDKFEQQINEKVRVNESKSQNYNVEINETDCISIYAGFPFSARLS